MAFAEYTAARLIAIAKAEIGYLEKASNSQLDDKKANAGSNNYTKYARDLYKAGYYNGNKNGFAWCDIFVDWCFYKLCGDSRARAENLTCTTGDLGAGCEYSMRYYKEANRLYKSPQPGDQIFFGTSSKEVAHTGIVYKVDNKKVYTIEGNTSSASGVIANGGAVESKSYSLSYYKILGYGRPRYSGITGNQAGDSYYYDDFYNNSSNSSAEAVPIDYFTLAIDSISATKASISVGTTTLSKASSYIWSYSLTNLILNTVTPMKRLSSVSSILLDDLIPSTPYVLKLSAADALSTIEQQLFFSTTNERPEAIRNLSVSFDDADLQNKTCIVTFRPPSNWGAYKSYGKKGYRISLLLNGSIVASSDSLIKANASTDINCKIALIDLLKLNNTSIQHTDTLQVGIQTWVKDSNGKIILNSSYPASSKPLYLKHFLPVVDKVYLRIADTFKRAIFSTTKKI